MYSPRELLNIKIKAKIKCQVSEMLKGTRDRISDITSGKICHNIQRKREEKGGRERERRFK